MINLFKRYRIVEVGGKFVAQKRACQCSNLLETLGAWHLWYGIDKNKNDTGVCYWVTTDCQMEYCEVDDLLTAEYLILEDRRISNIKPEEPPEPKVTYYD